MKCYSSYIYSAAKTQIQNYLALMLSSLPLPACCTSFFGSYFVMLFPVVVYLMTSTIGRLSLCMQCNILSMSCYWESNQWDEICTIQIWIKLFESFLMCKSRFICVFMSTCIMKSYQQRSRWRGARGSRTSTPLFRHAQECFTACSCAEFSGRARARARKNPCLQITLRLQTKTLSLDFVVAKPWRNPVILR